MIYDVARSLHEGHGLAKALYDEAVKMLSERGLVEIIGLCGYYTLVSMTLNTFEFELPEGKCPNWRDSEAGCTRAAATNGAIMPETHPIIAARGSGTFISRSPISIARLGFIAACSGSS